MKFGLRTLLIAGTVGPPLLAGGYFLCRDSIGAWVLMLFIIGLVVFWMRSGGLPESSRFPPGDSPSATCCS
ncbi:MAG: hypothetical protein ACR2FY_06940 [Pirellulaceae bacterium]